MTGKQNTVQKLAAAFSAAALAGRRESRYWGTTAISSYLTFKTTGDYDGTSTPEYSERIIFDSLTLYMVPDSTFCGDTT